MDSEQEDQRSGFGSREDSIEALELLLSWILAAGVVALFLLVAAVLAVQEQTLVADVDPRLITRSPTMPLATVTPADAEKAPSLAPDPTGLPPAASPSSSSSESKCDIPPGWVEYRIKWGDSLSGLASEHGLSIKALKEANCLERNTIFAGSALWVPSGTGLPATGTAILESPPAKPTVTESPTFLATPRIPTVGSALPTRAPLLATITPDS